MALAFFEGACICEVATVQMVLDRALDRSVASRSTFRYSIRSLSCHVQREGTVRFPAGVRREVAAPLLITRRVFVSHQGATVWCLACAQPSRRGSSATTSLRPLARMVFGRRGLLPEPWKSRSSL